jgi:hypothetical protein
MTGFAERLAWVVSVRPASIMAATVTVAGGRALRDGQVLGRAPQPGKYVAHDPTARDGSQIACAVLYADVPGADGDHRAWIVAGRADVCRGALNGTDGINDETAAQLAAVSIKAV